MVLGRDSEWNTTPEANTYGMSSPPRTQSGQLTCVVICSSAGHRATPVVDQMRLRSAFMAHYGLGFVYYVRNFDFCFLFCGRVFCWGVGRGLGHPARPHRLLPDVHTTYLGRRMCLSLACLALGPVSVTNAASLTTYVHTCMWSFQRGMGCWCIDKHAGAWVVG